MHPDVRSGRGGTRWGEEEEEEEEKSAEVSFSLCFSHYSCKVVNQIDELQIHHFFVHSHEMFLHLQLFRLASKATPHIISLRDQEIGSLNLSRVHFMQN